MALAISISSSSSPTLSPSSCYTAIPTRRTTAATSSPLSISFSSSFLRTTSARHQSRAIRAPGRARIRTRRLTCTCLFGLGVPELVVIAGVAALLFGPKQLPEVGRSIGKTVKSFQQAAKEFESELKKEPNSATEVPVEKPTAAVEEEKKEVEVPGGTKDSL